MSDFISKRELYRKLGEAYQKGYLSWGANEVIKDIIGECDSVENKGDLISRQAVFNIIEREQFKGDAILEIEKLPSVENKGEWSRHTRVEPVYSIDGVKTWGDKCQCNRCTFTTIAVEGFGYYNFCPNCGADMRKPVNGEEDIPMEYFESGGK